MSSVDEAHQLAATSASEKREVLNQIHDLLYVCTVHTLFVLVTFLCIQSLLAHTYRCLTVTIQRRSSGTEPAHAAPSTLRRRVFEFLEVRIYDSTLPICISYMVSPQPVWTRWVE